MLKIAWSPIYHHPLPQNHRFPMEKYSLLPQQLMHEGTASQQNFFAPPPLAEKHILTTHSPQYWQRLQNGQLSRKEERATGFPHSPQLIQREIIIANGTLLATQYAQQYGIAFNIAGGTHHAFTNRGEGFCLLNDIAIAANYLLQSQQANNILVIDLDVHQGNGTAQIFKNQTSVFTFSMHGANNYPLRKEKSDKDIALPDNTPDAPYLYQLRRHLFPIIWKYKPDFIFYQAGVDVLATDKLGRLALSLHGCRQRCEIVLQTCHRLKIPCVVTMGGGYSPKIATIIEAHANTYRLAQKIYNF